MLVPAVMKPVPLDPATLGLDILQPRVDPDEFEPG